jgi:hypothetical protein
MGQTFFTRSTHLHEKSTPNVLLHDAQPTKRACMFTLLTSIRLFGFQNRVFGIDFKLKSDSMFRTAALIHRDTAFKMIHQQSIEAGLSWMGQNDKHLFVPGMIAESLEMDEVDRENLESSALYSPITPPEDLRFAFDLEYDESLHNCMDTSQFVVFHISTA